MGRGRRLDVMRPLAALVGLTLWLAPAAASAQRPPAAPSPPQAKPLAQSLPPDARRDYDAGKLLYEDGDYGTALLKYQAAYDRTHDPRLLWNVAVCQKNLRHYAKAASVLARYVEGGSGISTSDRKDAQELLKAIAPFTVAQTLHVSEPGAQVVVDDAVVGTSPLPGPVALDMGTRRVRVRKEGFRIFEEEVPIGGSAPTTTEIVLARQVGHLILNVPAGAVVVIDDKEAGRGPRVELDLSVGAHAARVTAPRMHPLQTDVLVEDGKSRALDLGLEAETTASAEVRVAVACTGPDPTSERDLTVFFDDSAESALPLGVRRRREPDREVVAYIPYAVAPGKHSVHVAARGCSGRDTEINVPEGGVADVRGELPPANSYFDGSPAGSPDGWRVSGGLVTSSTTFPNYGNFFQSNPLSGQQVNAVGVTLVGPVASVGLEGRWLTAMLDARLLFAHVKGSGTETVYDSTLSEWSVGVRPGVRLPLVVAAVSAGVGFHVGRFNFVPDQAGSPLSGGFYSESLWAAIDAQPFCAWGAQLGGALSADQYAGRIVDNGSVTSFWLHATYTPNSLCDRRRAGLFKIVGTTHGE